MFAPKSFKKLPATAREVYLNKLKLDELAMYNPFETTFLNGLQVLSHPEFEDFYRVLNSLRVMDDNGMYQPRQTEDLKKDIIKTSRQETFIELLYNTETPDKDLYLETLKEKLMINLVNLLIDPEIPTDRNLSGPEIYQVKETFKQMLASA